jgi:hypothetical protein
MAELYVDSFSSTANLLTFTGEHRIFDFTPESTAKEAHLEETEDSMSSRGAEKREHDPHVLEELIKVSSNESQGQ